MERNNIRIKVSVQVSQGAAYVERMIAEKTEEDVTTLDLADALYRVKKLADRCIDDVDYTLMAEIRREQAADKKDGE